MVTLDAAQLEALSAAVAEGTFEAAARALHVTPSAVSQRIKALELSAGRVLLTRSKPVRPTPSGEVLLRVARQVQAVSADALAELGGDRGGGPAVVALAVNAYSLATWLVPALASVGGEVVFDLRREDQDRTARLLQEGVVMAAITASPEPVTGCSVEPLGRMRYRPRASRTFAERWFPEGATVASLSAAPVVVFDRDDRLQDRYLRRRTRRACDPPRHHVPGSGAYVAAVRLGLGWGMVPDLQVPPGESGLVEIDPQGVIEVELFWQQWRLPSPSLERVGAAVRSGARALLR